MQWEGEDMFPCFFKKNRTSGTLERSYRYGLWNRRLSQLNPSREWKTLNFSSMTLYIPVLSMRGWCLRQKWKGRKCSSGEKKKERFGIFLKLLKAVSALPETQCELKFLSSKVLFLWRNRKINAHGYFQVIHSYSTTILWLIKDVRNSLKCFCFNCKLNPGSQQH